MKNNLSAPLPAGAEKGQAKTARIPVKIEPTTEFLRKPAWIRVKAPVTPEVVRLKKVLRSQSLHTVCEEANCPNLMECFSSYTLQVLGLHSFQSRPEPLSVFFRRDTGPSLIQS